MSGASPTDDVPSRTTAPSLSIGIPAARLSRTSSTSDPLSEAHPLNTPGDNSTGSPYAVYTAKRRSQHSPETKTVIAGPRQDDTILSPPSPSPTHPTPSLAHFANSDPALPKSGRSSSPLYPGGDAKQLLIGQNLRADVQRLGLDTLSAGCAFVKLLSNLDKEREWSGILSAIANGGGRITLLLPAEKVGETIKPTPANFLDHLIVIEASKASTSSKPASGVRGFVTLSGLRGTLDSNELTISSCGASTTGWLRLGSLHPPNLSDAELHHALAGSASPSIVPNSTFPTFRILSAISDLSIPRLATARAREQGRQNTSTGSRLAALFAKPAPISQEMSTTSSSQASSSDEAIEQHALKLSIPVLVISNAIRYSAVNDQVSQSLATYLRSRCSEVQGCDSNTIDKIVKFSSRFQPPPKVRNAFPQARTSSGGRLFDESVENVSDLVQVLLEDVRHDLSQKLHGPSSGGSNEDLGATEELIDISLNQIEDILLHVLYDRLFSPPNAADRQADENLSSRIAALNLLDLSLEHLGLDLGGEGGSDGWDENSRTIKDGLEDIVSLAGKELARLQDEEVRTASGKISVFVNVHQVIVDGLSRLPPIPFKDRKPDVAPGTGRRNHDDVEMDDASVKSRSGKSSKGATSTGSKASSLRSLSPPNDPRPTPPSRDSADSSVFDSAKRDAAGPRTSSADHILPLLIYLVVRYNQPQLCSHLLFIQRFRSDTLLRGQGSFVTTNISAVVEFLTHVDMAALGLSSHKVTGYSSIEGGNSIGISKERSRITKENLTQELDQFVDTANVAIFNTMRSLFGPKGLAPKTLEEVKTVLDGAGSVANKARDSFIRKSNLPHAVQKEMIDIMPGNEPVVNEEEEEAFLRSEGRPSIGDRLASIPGLSRFGGPETKGMTTVSGSSTPAKASLFSAFSPRPSPTVPSNLGRTNSPSNSVRPIQRFMECGDAGDLTLKEVVTLLEDYKRLAIALAQ